jgi:hypothetical protein
MEADEIDLTGAFLPEGTQDSYDSIVKVDTEVARAKKFSITGSDFRKPK